MSIKTLVCEYLSSLKRAGQLTLPVDEAARGVLRAWMLAKKRGVPVAASPANEPPVQADAAASAQDDEIRSAIAELHRVIGTPDEAEDEPEKVFFRPGGSSPQEAWELGARMLPRWTPLQELGSLRSTPIWAVGSLSAAVMFVGDAPGYYDEQGGHPFCGEAGAKLDGILKAMNLSRELAYITYLVKFRPMVPQQTTNNRPPNREEVRLSLPVLEFEVNLVRPKVIVALGVIAARALLRQEDLPLAACRQVRDAVFCGVPVVVTHNPGYLLRTTDLTERRSLWEDMLRAMELAHLPITDKQRGYFLPKK